MPKNIEDMIVPERRRSIRNIPIPEGRRKPSGYNIPPAPQIPPTYSSPTPIQYSTEPKRMIPRKRLWIVAGASIIVLVFAVLSIFDGATLAYIPKSVAVSFDNDTYTANKSGEGVLLYSVIKLSMDKGLEASASGEEQVNRKASGTIVVFNTTNQSQRFRATTRFKTPEGKIYQVPDTIVVPAKKVVGGVSQPGSLEVVVYAERPGVEYNIGLSDFTLPGLDGTSLSSSVYARSKTEMSGGFVGLEKVVNAEDEMKVRTELQTALETGLLSEAQAQAPEGFILFPSLSSITFEDLPQTVSDKKNSATVNMRGNLYGVMFKKNDLSTHLSKEKATLAPTDTVLILELDSLNLTLKDMTSSDLLISDEIEFSVSGTATMVWVIDETALKADLVGRQNRDVPSILSNYPNIESATVTIRPFWRSSFPSDSSNVTIKKLDVK